jgi:hypothetical protein
MSKVTKENLFKSSPRESKSHTTDQIFRGITEDEASRRERKTEKLRAARLAKEAEDRDKQPAEAPTKKRGRRSPARPKQDISK